VREAVTKNCVVYDEPTRTATRKALLDDTVSVTSRSALVKALADYDCGMIASQVLKIEISDGAIAEKTLSLNLFTTFNYKDPLLLMIGLKLVEDAKVSV
jgi:hypothetical protein